MSPAVYQWAARHGVNYVALNELAAIFGMHGAQELPTAIKGTSEAAVQASVRLEAARKGVRLFRNNVGVLMDATGRPVRYGLANDSRQLNASIKSADLIGWRPVVVGGISVAQFVSRECKPVGWRYTGRDREPAQLAWAQLVTAAGGDAAFCCGAETL